MNVDRTADALGRMVGRLPGISGWRARRYAREFVRHDKPTKNLYQGVFDTYAEAQASVPANHFSGYDNTPSAELYRDRTRRVFINDYPMMLWLGKLFEAGCTSVFDIGGHIGVAYYAYQRYVPFPKGVRWTVFDVPAVNRAGAAWAVAHDDLRRLSFADDYAGASGADVLFAAGSLQYLECSLKQILESLDHLPDHLLLNSVPVHPSASYFTVQNMGTACCPYRVTAERTFIDGLKALGYEMQDRWENPHRSCVIPFHPERSLDRYFGFYFKRDKKPAV
jgi:putative methyltransferase (TIGR04325 family)